MAQKPHRVIGDYIVTHKIGAGSFAVVSKGRHRVHGTEVAIKEIATDNLNRKLQESLESEIAILKRANHPNIIRLLEIVKSPDKIYLILEYCAGGDLSDYIRRNGRVKESTARHFMRQLGAGLQVLRANNLIHRDLKPQNLLLSTKDKSAVLKIADFGFARSLQPQGLAETLCGSPLYMAPEILQFQKYDAKADLWSVGAILFELITGRPPFGGQNHVQLLRNIEKTEAVIPSVIAGELSDSCISLCRLLLRRNPVERLSFEEFFHHSFLDLQSSLRWCRFKGTEPVEALRSEAVLTSPGRRETGGARDSNTNSGVRNIEVSSGNTPASGQCTDDCLPFALDEDQQNMSDIRRAPSSGSVKGGNGGTVERGSQGKVNTRESTEKFVKNEESSMVESNVHTERGAAMSGITDTSGPTATGDSRKAGTGDASGVGRGGSSSDSRQLPGDSRGQTEVSGNARFGRLEGRDCDGGSSREGSVREGLSTDSMECIEREYVVVDAPLKMSSEPVSPQRPPRISWTRSQTTPVRRTRRSPSPSPAVPARSPSVPLAVPVSISGASGGLDLMGSRGSTPSSYDSAEVIDAPSPHPPTRLASLQRSARLVNVVAMDKLEAQQPLEALSLQLLCLAIWRQILEVCHSWAASAAEGISPPFREVRGGSTAMSVSLGVGYGGGPEEGGDQEAAAAAACEIMEREFLLAVEKAEEVARHVGPREVSEMPDAVELVFQSALAVGRASAVEELMGNVSNAAVGYAKASALFFFLLVEAPTLPLEPSFELPPSDRYRLRRYADSVIARQNQCSAARLQFSQQRHVP